MPGIYGVVARERVLPKLKGMAKAMHLYDHLIQDELYCDEAIGASRVHLGHVGARQSPETLDGHCIWIEGEAYNVDEVAQELRLDNDGLGTLLLSAEREDRLEACLNKLDGYFCAALYDGNHRKIKLISDRYGMRLLYWYHRSGLFVWGSEVKAILAVDSVNKKFDPSSFDCFLEIGYLLGEHTWFEHIRLVKPATVLEFDIQTGALKQHYYWTWGAIEKSSMSFDTAVDKLGERFIESVGRRFDPGERIGISLSGGLDSRAIFAAVYHLYPEYEGYAYTFGLPGCDDITLAEKVVAKSNWRHDKFYFSEENWFEPRLKKVWHTDGMMDMKHMHGSEFLDLVSEMCNINFNGYLGDAVLGGSYLWRSDKKNERIGMQIANLHYSGYADGYDDRFWDIAHYDNYLFMMRGRRFINYGTVNALPWIDQRKPFFDNSIIELVFALPDEYRVNNRLYSTMLHRFFPKFFRDIPWQNTGKLAGVLTPPSIPKRAINRLVKHFNAMCGKRSTTGYTDYAAWIRLPGIATQLAELLDPQTAEYRKILERDYSATHLRPHLSNTLLDNSNEILRVATVEIYLRQLKEHQIRKLLNP